MQTQHTTPTTTPSEQPGSPAIRRFRELLQLVQDTEADNRVRRLLASRPADAEPGTFHIREYPDGSVYFGWTAPLSDWLRPAPRTEIGGGA